MRIELNAGGLSGVLSVAAFGAQYGNMVTQTKNVVKAFKAVESQVHNMNGGVGNLQEAVDHLENRITQTDEKRLEKMENVGQRFSAFINSTVQTDKAVAGKIALSNLGFALKNPWARPKTEHAKSAGQKALDWLRDKYQKLVATGKKIIDTGKKVLDYIGQKVKKAWDSTVQFCKDHWKSIAKVVIGTVVIVGLFALTAATGGAAAVIIGGAAKMALVTALSSAAVNTVVGVAQGKSGGEIFDSAADGYMSGAINGAVSGAVSAGVGMVGPTLIKQGFSKAFAKGAQILAGGVGNVVKDFVKDGLSFFKENGTLKGFVGEFKTKALSSLIGGALSEGLSIAGDSLKNSFWSKMDNKFGGAKSGSKNFIQKWIHNKASDKPWFTNETAAVKSLKSSRDSVIFAFKDNYKTTIQKNYYNKAMGKVIKKTGFELITSIGKGIFKGDIINTGSSGGMPDFKSPMTIIQSKAFDAFNSLTINLSLPAVAVGA